MPRQLTVGGLFSGIGGFELGLQRAGFKIEWMVEIDPFCRRVLAKHWPDVRRYEDVRFCGGPFMEVMNEYAADGTESGFLESPVYHQLEKVDVVCGGFPCQPFSSASRGRKHGTNDARFLWPEMRRVVSELRPSWVVVENVTQLDGAGLEQVVSDLEAIGYEVAPPLEVPACAFGHDHWRPRLWILGHANGNRKPRLPVNGEVARLPWRGDDAGSVGEADGLSGRLDRRRMAALGNAIVPQIAEWIGRSIMAAQ